MAAPKTFAAAVTWLKGRATLPTSLGSRELALAPDFPAAAKMQAFFSARVTSANILEALREQVGQIAAGEVDYATARMRLKTFLGAQGIPADDVGMTPEPPPGVSEEDWRARREIVNLASTRRLDLVLRQNVAMAHAVGQREVSMDPAVQERWPYFRYIAEMDGRERPEHGRLNNLVLRKDDPFWATHTPPWDYGCRCQIEDADEDEARRYGKGETTASGKVVNPGTGQFVDTNLSSESGFTFDITAAMSASPADYDWSLIQDSVLRERAQAQAAEIADFQTKVKPRVKSIDDLTQTAKQFAADVDLSAVDRPERAETAIKVLDDVYQHTGMKRLDRFGFDIADPAGDVDKYTSWAWYDGNSQVNIAVEGLSKYSVDDWQKSLQSLEGYRSKYSGKDLEGIDQEIASLKRQIESVLSGRHDYYPEHSAWAFQNLEEGVVRHELGHAWHHQNMDAIEQYLRKNGIELGGTPSLEKYGVTLRGADSLNECMAENFALFSSGKTEKMHPDIIGMFRELTSWKH